MNARNDILIDYETYDEVEEFWKPIPSFQRWDASNLGNIRNRKKVMIDETGEVFDSVRDLASYFRISSTNVSRVLSGSRRGQRIHGVHIREVDERFENDHQS